MYFEIILELWIMILFHYWDISNKIINTLKQLMYDTDTTSRQIKTTNFRIKSPSLLYKGYLWYQLSLIENCQKFWFLCGSTKGLYIKYPGGGSGGFLSGSWNILGSYWWAMKYLSKLLGNKIFSYVLFS